MALILSAISLFYIWLTRSGLYNTYLYILTLKIGFALKHWPFLYLNLKLLFEFSLVIHMCIKGHYFPDYDNMDNRKYSQI